MSDCTHDCNTCGGDACGCHMETTDGQKPRDVLVELKKFMAECEDEEIDNMLARMAAELDKEMA